MKAANCTTCLLVIGLIMVLMLPLAAYAQRPSGGSGTSSGSVSSGASSAGSTGGDRGSAGGVSYSGGGYYSGPTRDVGVSTYGGGPASGIVSSPRFPVNSSFNGYNYYPFMSYYSWMNMNFTWFQLMQLGLLDTRRFMVNREPLITPQALHLTLETPLAASERLVTAVDALQAMVDDMQAGKPVSKDQISAKTQEIRELAKRIRSYPPLAFFDLGKREDVSKDASKAGLGAIDQLREMALALNGQLKSMYNQSATSTVSVNSLNQASLQSLSKGIEKLSKTIENAKPRT